MEKETRNFFEKNINAVLGFSILTVAIIALIILTSESKLAEQGSNPTILPQGESQEKTVTIDEEEKEIMVTEGVLHSVPLEDIIGGGPPKDGIPSIDQPKFIPSEKADGWLDDSEPGIYLSLDGIDRFYPFQILVWHEIVNDTMGGERVLVTYCPLCFTGIVFDPVVDGERVEFGTSGKLWNSNLVMYDRKTDSLWSQVLTEAIVGPMTGAQLKVITSDVISYGDFKKVALEGEVLSRDTGATRFYGQDPYGDYYTSDEIYFPVEVRDDRLEPKDFVLGIVIDGQAKAYYTEAIKKIGELEENFAGREITVRYDQEIDAIRIYEKKADGEIVRLNPFGVFWFSWVSAHPDTELYK